MECCFACYGFYQAFVEWSGNYTKYAVPETIYDSSVYIEQTILKETMICISKRALGFLFNGCKEPSMDLFTRDPMKLKIYLCQICRILGPMPLV